MNILNILKCREQRGDIGIEIEMEADHMPHPDDVGPKWKLERDGSLRGESGEFVLRTPVSEDKLDEVFENLSDILVKSGTKVRPTYRAGVHVHINVQDLTPRQLITFITLYFMFEEVLLSYCDKSRTGNHFCMRMSDASYLLLALTEAITSEDLTRLNDENLRYAALNVTSLFKYGSIEFRALESTRDFDKIKTWSRILYRLKEFSKTVGKPTDVLGLASEQGFVSFGKAVFGDFYAPFSKFMTEEAIQTGVRNIQFAAYSRNWDTVQLNIFKKKSLF